MTNFPRKWGVDSPDSPGTGAGSLLDEHIDPDYQPTEKEVLTEVADWMAQSGMCVYIASFEMFLMLSRLGRFFLVLRFFLFVRARLQKVFQSEFV